MTTSLERASETGKLLDDVLRCPVPRRAETQTATYHALGQCVCGLRVPILITVRLGSVPRIVRAAVCGEHCPECGAALSPATVTYLGISGPGWPFVPATVVSTWKVSPVIADRKPVAAQRIPCRLERDGDGESLSAALDRRIDALATTVMREADPIEARRYALVQLHQKLEFRFELLTGRRVPDAVESGQAEHRAALNTLWQGADPA